jgi:hypothetical protein
MKDGETLHPTIYLCEDNILEAMTTSRPSLFPQKSERGRGLRYVDVPRELKR